jgi:hypothetical protein
MVNEEGDDKTGYGKPPRKNQFEKGKSGNPNGRPKGAKSISSILANMSRERVMVTTNGKSRNVTKLEAIFMQLNNKAASGDLKAIRELLSAHRIFPEPVEEAHAPAAPNERDEVVMKSILKRLRSTESAQDSASESEPNPAPKKEEER